MSWNGTAERHGQTTEHIMRGLICSFGNNGKSLPWKFAGSLAVLVVKVHPETRRPLYMGSLCNRTTALYKSWWTWTEKLINSKQSIEYICAKLNYTTFSLKSHRSAINARLLVHFYIHFGHVVTFIKYWTDIFDLLSKVYKKILFQIQWLPLLGWFLYLLLVHMKDRVFLYLWCLERDWFFRGGNVTLSQHSMCCWVLAGIIHIEKWWFIGNDKLDIFVRLRRNEIT